MVSLCAKLSYVLGYVAIESIGSGCRHTGLFPGLVPLELGVGVRIMAATVDSTRWAGVTEGVGVGMLPLSIQPGKTLSDGQASPSLAPVAISSSDLSRFDPVTVPLGHAVEGFVVFSVACERVP